MNKFESLKTPGVLSGTRRHSSEKRRQHDIGHLSVDPFLHKLAGNWGNTVRAKRKRGREGRFFCFVENSKHRLLLLRDGYDVHDKRDVLRDTDLKRISGRGWFVVEWVVRGKQRERCKVFVLNLESVVRANES